MDLSRFHRAINEIVVDYEEQDVAKHLTTLENNLASLVANPGNAQTNQAFKDHLETLRQTLLQSTLNSPNSDVLDTLAIHDLANYVGSRLFQRIKDILEQNQLAPNLAATEIQKLRLEMEKKLGLVTTVDNAFTDLKIPISNLAGGKTEMLLRLPMGQEAKTLEDLAKESKDWHQICRSIAETFDAEHSPVTIRSVASGSILLYLAATPAFIFGIAKCLKGVNQIFAEVIKMKALYAQLVETKLPVTFLSEYEKHREGKASIDLEQLASSLVDEHYSGDDPGRKNELKTSLSMSLKRLSQKLATGTTVTLRLVKPKKPKIEDGAEPSEAQMNTLKEIENFEKIQIEVDSSRAALDYKEHAQELTAALPAPASDELDAPVPK